MAVWWILQQGIISCHCLCWIMFYGNNTYAYGLNVSCVYCRQRSVPLELVWTASITVVTMWAARTQTLNHQTIVLLVSWDSPLNWLITSNSTMKCGFNVKYFRLLLGIYIDNCHLQNEALGLIRMPTHRNLYFTILQFIITVQYLLH